MSRIPDEVLDELTIYDIHTGEWLGGWPSGGHPEDAIDRLKKELRECREALKRVQWILLEIEIGRGDELGENESRRERQEVLRCLPKSEEA